MPILSEKICTVMECCSVFQSCFSKAGFRDFVVTVHLLSGFLATNGLVFRPWPKVTSYEIIYYYFLCFYAGFDYFQLNLVPFQNF